MARVADSGSVYLVEEGVEIILQRVIVGIVRVSAGVVVAGIEARYVGIETRRILKPRRIYNISFVP